MQRLSILIFALAAPLLLLPLEQQLPYPHIFEELAKVLVIFWLLKTDSGNIPEKKPSNQANHPPQTDPLLKWVVAFGLLFTISESILYLMNFFILGNAALLPLRLVLTGVLHTGTTVLIYCSLKKNLASGALGLVMAMAIHYGYNYWLAPLFL